MPAAVADTGTAPESAAQKDVTSGGTTAKRTVSARTTIEDPADPVAPSAGAAGTDRRRVRRSTNLVAVPDPEVVPVADAEPAAPTAAPADRPEEVKPPVRRRRKASDTAASDASTAEPAPATRPARAARRTAAPKPPTDD